MMINSLLSKNKVSFLDGTLSKPDNFDPKVSKVCCIHLLLVIYGYKMDLRSLGSMSVLHSSCACDIWKDLEDSFCQSSTAQLSSIIQQDLAKLSQENDDITVFLHR